MSKKISNKKPLFGVGINDADYPVHQYITQPRNKGKQIKKLIWTCPYYKKWRDMLYRCYGKVSKNKRSYLGCTCTPSWFYLSNFKAWMETQNWDGKQLDKDLLVRGNKIYSPETCLFVSAKVNNFILESTSARGEHPIGVTKNNYGGFSAYCTETSSGRRTHLGTYPTPQEAHQAWLTFKLSQARILATQQEDLKVAEALIYRYEYYHNYC